MLEGKIRSGSRRSSGGGALRAPRARRARVALAAVAASLAALLGLSTVALASTWNTGDVFLGVSGGQYQVRAPDGTLKETLTSAIGGFTTGCALDKAGDFYGTYFTGNAVEKFSGVHPHAETPFGSNYSTPESITFDGAGNVYVGNIGNGINQYSASGTFIKNVINTRVDWFDIAADQDTILYTTEGTSIHRVSISTGASLPDFTTGTAVNAFALRILSDGGVLLADRDNVKRYNAAGVVVQTYDVTGEDNWFSLNLDPNATSFWAGDFGTANYYRFNIATGAVEAGPFNTGTGFNSLFGICLKGELRAADATITLSPLTATNPVGTSHSVTATVSDGKAGTVVTFKVTSGPHAGITATGITDATGKTTFTYLGSVAGTDTLVASFIAASGAEVKSNEVTKTWTPPPDNTPPTCSGPTVLTVAGKKVIEVFVQDSGSGIATIVPTTTNATSAVDPYTPGTKSPVRVRATKTDQSKGATLTLVVTDVAGNSIKCDPTSVTLKLKRNGWWTQRMIRIPAAERYLRIDNGRGGLSRLAVTVNGARVKVMRLKAGRTVVVDLGLYMSAGNRNRITLHGYGRTGRQATLTIHD